MPWGRWLNVDSIGSEIDSVRFLSFFVAGLILLSAIATAIFTRERFAKSNRKHVKLMDACRGAMSCKPFRTLLLLQIVRTLGTSFYATLATYIGIYYVCQGDKTLFAKASIGLGGVAGFVFSMIMWPAAKPLTKKIGKQWGLIITFGISFLYAILLPFITLPGHIYLLVFSGFALILPMAVQNLFLTSLMPDICDIDELNFGERREGLFSAVKSFVDKIEISLCNLLGLGMLSYIGFNADLKIQPTAVLTKMLWFAFVPKIVFSGLALVLTFYMPVTERMMAGVRHALEERRKSKLSNVQVDHEAEAYDAAPATVAPAKN
jgi:GPH family glycoside/pentoside/hexuronide:cation symporter